MVLAQGAALRGLQTVVSRIDTETTSIPTHAFKQPTAKAQPSMTANEQYWAARALTAEALLSAKVMHQQELSYVTSDADAKRVQEVASVRKTHEIRESRLEKLVLALSATLVGFMTVFIYYSLSTGFNGPRKHSGMHFTIPILSPFASVVEHETSVIGSKMLTVFAVIVAICLYGCFRYWLASRVTR
ncbi:hypothetical protein BC835DRAFT_1291698 [Cytidiella melzeri]|nr:hypothetical protein BC835DRAFT_1291698 [Cytidiella melzeri]